MGFTENRARSDGAPDDSGWAGYPWSSWYSTNSGAVVNSGLSANPNQEIETTGWVDGSTPNSVRAAQWLSKYHTGALPSNYTITKRPANWQNTRFASQFDADGTFDPESLPNKHVVEPYGAGDLPLHIGYFNGGHFVADPDCNDPRSQLWEMPVLGIAREPYKDSVAGVVESKEKFKVSDRASSEPGFRVFIDADGNGIWDPATEQLADGLPIALETCSRGENDLNWNCENLSSYNAATTSRGVIGGAYGTEAGNLWTQEIPLTGNLGLDDPELQMVGRGGLRYIPPGLEVTTRDAKGANHLRTSWADPDGMVQPPEDHNDTSIWQFHNIGLRPKALDTAVTLCDTTTSTCPRGAKAVLTITNNTGVTHREVKPTMTVTVGGRQVVATCTAVARLANGESTTCTVDWTAKDGDTKVSAVGGATSSMRFASTRYPVTAKQATGSATLEEPSPPGPTPTPPATPSVTPAPSQSTTPAPSQSPTVTPTPSQEPTAPSRASPRSTRPSRCPRVRCPIPDADLGTLIPGPWSRGPPEPIGPHQESTWWGPVGPPTWCRGRDSPAAMQPGSVRQPDGGWMQHVHDAVAGLLPGSFEVGPAIGAAHLVVALAGGVVDDDVTVLGDAHDHEQVPVRAVPSLWHLVLLEGDRGHQRNALSQEGLGLVEPGQPGHEGPQTELVGEGGVEHPVATPAVGGIPGATGRKGHDRITVGGLDLVEHRDRGPVLGAPVPEHHRDRGRRAPHLSPAAELGVLLVVDVLGQGRYLELDPRCGRECGGSIGSGARGDGGREGRQVTTGHHRDAVQLRHRAIAAVQLYPHLVADQSGVRIGDEGVGLHRATPALSIGLLPIGLLLGGLLVGGHRAASDGAPSRVGELQVLAPIGHREPRRPGAVLVQGPELDHGPTVAGGQDVPRDDGLGECGAKPTHR